MTANGYVSHHKNKHVVWQTVDASLLLLTFMSCGQLLIQTGFQSYAWMVCYGLVLLRVAMNWRRLKPVLLRNKVIFAYSSISLASVLWSLQPQSSLIAALQLNMTMLIAFYLGWRYSVIALVSTITLVFALGVVVSLIHWATVFLPWPVYTQAGGLAGLFSHKNMLGGRALFLTIFLLAFLLMVPRRGALRSRACLFFALALSLFALFLSKAMTSVLLVIALAGILFVLCNSRIPKVISIIVGGILLGALSFGPIVLTILNIDPVDTLLSVVGKDTTLTGRTLLWSVATDVIAEYPVLGVGYGAFWQAPLFANQVLLTQYAGAVTSTSFHNFALEILVASGPLGLLAMVALVCYAITRLWRLYRWSENAERSIVSAACIALIIGALGDATTGASLYRQHEFYLIFIAALSVSADEDWLHELTFRYLKFLKLNTA